MKLLRPLDIKTDGVALKRYPSLLAPAFQRLQQATYDSLRPGENTANKLKRGIGWAVFAHDKITWLDRTEYSLPANLNPEERGNVRRFLRLDEMFLTAPELEEVFRDVFQQWSFREPSSSRAYELQTTAIRYESTTTITALPSPIIPHQDQVDGAVVVLNKTGPIIGGISRIFNLDGAPLYEFDLDVGEAMFVKDDRVLHQVTPIQLAPDQHWRPGDRGWRDILIIRFASVGR
jgi:hypothetical protein